ncbi:alpha/beta fold hydrolase [Aquisalimonas asiatica]|uniref:Pimeloyl-ACP methyl ester carboxylesterase n=1 Tax=Aquisalimonas asiatica TaxID=406100 RepID=A0A1H8TEA6_9GAMM|nr:alpha/beta fold hydrolase [Aquisalimonas asiatica]SEO88924.1 Pimeloyl-ACP methyl ester carboxylesterase [Aquisalimonas asiatica]
MAEVTNEGGRLYYEIHGEGTPVVLLMGLGGSGRAWGLQLPDFARRHRVLLPDNRGVGRSDMPPGPYTMAGFAADLDAVLNAADIDSAHLVGVSMGGLIAQEYYHLHPHRVRSMTLVATGVGPADPAYVPPERHIWEVLELDRATTDERTVVERMNATFYHPDYLERIPDLADRILQFQAREPQPPHAYHAQLHSAGTHTLNSPRLHQVDVPCLVVHGEDDRVWPPENARYLATHLPNAELELMPRTAHMLPLEQPRAFNTRVLRFLADVDAERQ